jgi:N-methylhydantoinase B/oxoprolinase/acetone carboxylase alpha subunit
MGIRRDYRLLADASDGMYYVEQTDPAFGARGREGGGTGAPGRAMVQRAGTDAPEPVPGKGYILLHRDDVLSLVGAGGGGFGSQGAAGPDGSTHPSEEES